MRADSAVITSQPAPKTVAAGQDAGFGATIDVTFNVGDTGPTYQWQTASSGTAAWSNIASNSIYKVTNYPNYTFDPQYSKPTTGYVNSTLTITNATTALDGSLYRCVVFSSGGIPLVTSAAAMLTVRVVPAITTQPANTSATSGQNAAFTVVVADDPAPTYRWQSSQWQSSTSSYVWTDIAGNSTATTDTLTLTSVTTAISGTQYRCIVTTSTGGSLTSNAATLTVNFAPISPFITAQPANQSVIVGQLATFTVAAAGDPAPNLQWQSSLDGVTWANFAGATSGTWTFYVSTIFMNGGQYRCVATNSIGAITSNIATLTVNAAPAPAFIEHPASQTVYVGQNVIFTVAATGNPAPTYQWQSAPIGSSTWTNITDAISDTLTLANVTGPMNGTQYRCVASNSVGTATSNAAKLTVTTPIIYPSITFPESQSVATGQTVTFAVWATGSPTPTLQWQSSPDGNTWTNISGATTGTLTLANVTAAMNGAKYRCIATNGYGTAVSNAATLTVTAPAKPTVTAVSPATAKAGDTITITGTNLTGATVTIGGQPATVVTISTDGTTLTVTVPANTTSSAIIVTTAAGSITAPPTITITPPPPVTPQLTLDKITLSLAQPANSTATFAITSNIAWVTSIDPASASAWLSVNPNAGTGNSSVTTAKAASANTNNAPRTASIIVNGGGITRTLIATQATNAAGYAPTGAALPAGATLTLTTGTPPTTRTYTVAANNKLTTTDATGTVTLAYEYNATGSTGTLVIPDLDSVYLLQFTNATAGNLALYTFDDAGSYELAGTFTYAAPAAPTYGLTVTNGTANGATTGAYAANATVTITANATNATGQVFDHWTTSNGGVFANANNATTTFTMPATATTVTATYKTQTTGGGGNTGGGNSGGGGGGGGAPSLLYLAAALALFVLRAKRRT